MSTTTELPVGLTAGTYSIDPAHSEIGFVTRHAMVAKVRGAFSGVTGTVVLDEQAHLIKADVTIDVATIDTRNADRDGHLKSPEFFDVATYPTATFVSTGVVVSPDGFDLEGDLTIHGVTRTVSLAVTAEGVATDPFGNVRAGFSGELELNRKEFGLTWNAALETGGVLVSDKIKLTLDISAIKAA